MNELIDKQIRKAKEDNRTIDRDQAYEEVVADSMETMLSSGRILQALADIRKQDRSLAEKIRTWFETFTEKLKSIVSTYKNIKPDSVEGRLVADMKDVISTFEALYGDALLDASENFDAEAQKNTAVGGVKYSLRMFEKDGRRFVEIDQNQDRFDGHDLSEYPRIAKDIINEKFNGQIIGTDNKMFVNGSSRDEFANPSKRISDTLYEAKMRTAGELDNLLDAGTNFRNAPDGADGHIHADVTNGFDYFDTLFKIGTRYYAAVINIKNIKKGKLFKDVTKIEDVTQDIMSSYGKKPKSQFLRTSSKNSIRNPGEKVNKKLSSRDTTQQKIREELEQENAKLKEDVSRLEELVKLQRTGTGGTKFTKTSVENAARMLKKYANVKRMASTEELTKLLHTFYESVASSEELSWDQVNEWAQPLFG